MLNAAVLVSALGYFVDVFDILLFSILRVPSLTDLGLSGDAVLHEGVRILNLQLLGLIAGGLIWGVIGDKVGRLSVLFGSILIYSLANIACAFTPSVEIYGWLRFIAGFGLAGELGAGITLVSELLSAEKRGWATTIITGVGLLGAVLAGIVGELLPWRVCYGIGGGLGLLLLFARMSVAESSEFLAIKQNESITKGSLTFLFTSGARVKRYLLCVLLGFPIMYVVYVLMTFSPELGQGLALMPPISAAQSILFCYIGISVGDFFFGAVSQWLKSRRKASLLSLLSLSITLLIFWLSPPTTAYQFYTYAVFLGFTSANWAVLMTAAAEQFGTNLRATATTSIPNMIRGSGIILTLFFKELKIVLPSFESAMMVGVGCILIALVALLYLPETYGKDLSFTDE